MNGSCPACGAPGGSPILEGTDHREQVGGWFSVVECPSCRLARTEPVPVNPGEWYPQGYQQHDAPDSVTASVVRRAISRSARARRRWAAKATGFVVPDAAYIWPVASGSHVLDVGAGNGTAVAALREAGLEAWGVEPSEAGFAAARSRGVGTVIHGTLEDALATGGIAASGWDVVRLYQVLEHVPDPVATLSVVRGLLAPGGRVVIGVPNFDSLARRLLGSAWDGLELPRHLTHFTPATLRAVLGRAGLRAQRVSTVALFGILPGSIDAATAGRRRQRGWGEALPVRGLSYPIELAYAAAGRGDGIMAEAVAA